MLRTALRDLQFRRRRFGSAVLGASLIFALSLTVAGLASSFEREVDDTISVMGVHHWLVASASPGPFTGFAPLPDPAASELAATGIEGEVSPLLIVRQPIGDGDLRKDAGLIGAEVGSLGSPRTVSSGHTVQADGQAVVSDSAGFDLGSSIVVGAVTFAVVGTVDATLLAGTTNVFVTLTDAQKVLGVGPVATVLATGSAAIDVPNGTREMSDAEVRRATILPLEDAVGTIDMMRSMLWVVAALIVGSILYLNAIERSRDVAVFKAIGLSNRDIVGSIVVQAAIVAVVAAVLANGMAVVLAPMFPLRCVLTLSSMLMMPVIAVVIALLASVAGIRRALGVSPALAFSGA